MPWTSESGTVYKLCLLDTNAISEILKHPKIEGRGFMEKFIRPGGFAPCITIYNIIELRRQPEIYEMFLKFFSVIPFFLLKPHQILFKDEIVSIQKGINMMPLQCAFTHIGQNNSYQLRTFVDKLFGTAVIKKLERDWAKEAEETLKLWLSYKDNFKPKKMYPNSNDAETYLKEAGIQTLMRLNPNWVKKELDNNRIPDIDQFPSVKVMLYSIYYRLYDPSWKRNHGEVTDVSIIAASPYVDVIITEKFQANVFDKIKNKIKGLESLDVFKLKDIRHK